MKRSEINVLIACECSQVECLAFRLQGFNAYSCDLQRTTNVYPEWHIHGDALQTVKYPASCVTQNNQPVNVSEWHLVIAHPPCTYLSKAGAKHLMKHDGMDEERYRLGLIAKQFFLSFFEFDVPFLAVENPIPMKIFELPRPTTKVNPYEFGEGWRKTTCLWLRNLPPLMPTLYVPKVYNYMNSARGGVHRSQSFVSIAKAMATQWGDFVESELLENC